MFYEMVQEEVEKIAKMFIIGEFLIGLEPFVEYVYFYCVANSLQQKGEKLTIKKYHENKMKNITDASDKNEVDSILGQYDKLVDYFNGMNFKNQMELMKRQQMEKKMGRMARYNGVPLFNYQLSEFEVLKSIKSEKIKENTTYKRIMSHKGYLSKTNFSEMEQFYDYLRNEINTSEEQRKNIRFYKLEKSMGFELCKSMLKALNQCRKTSHFDENQTIEDLLLVTPIPLISDRHKYADLYVELDWADKQIWRYELESIMTLLEYCIASMLSKVEETKYDILENVDWSRFDKIFLPSAYERDYKMRKDFYVEDYKALMKKVDKHNGGVRKIAVEFIQKHTE